MFYVVKNKEIKKKLIEWSDKEQDRKERAFKIAKKYGGDGVQLTDSYLFAIHFPKGNPGEDWIYEDRGCYRPHGKKKSAKKIREDFKSIEKMKPTLSVLCNNILNYETFIDPNSNKVSFCPGFKRVLSSGDLFLTTPDYVTKWKPPEGVEEITYTEYKRMSGDQDEDVS